MASGTPRVWAKVGIRDVFAFRAETRAQRFKRAQFSLAFAFFAQTAKGLFDDGGGPAQIEKPLSRPRFQGPGGNGELRRRLRHPIVPGNELHVAASLARVFLGDGIVQEILERLQEERAEPAPRWVRVPEPITFEDHEKKILSEILGVFGGVAAPADEGEDGTPVKPAKFRKRLARFLIVAFEIGGSEDETPARGREVARFATVFRCYRGVHERR